MLLAACAVRVVAQPPAPSEPGPSAEVLADVAALDDLIDLELGMIRKAWDFDAYPESAKEKKKPAEGPAPGVGWIVSSVSVPVAPAARDTARDRR